MLASGAQCVNRKGVNVDTLSMVVGSACSLLILFSVLCHAWRTSLGDRLCLGGLLCALLGAAAPLSVFLYVTHDEQIKSYLISTHARGCDQGCIFFQPT